MPDKVLPPVRHWYPCERRATDWWCARSPGIRSARSWSSPRSGLLSQV